jgi:hypothetical protein
MGTEQPGEVEDRAHRTFAELNRLIQLRFNGAGEHTESAFARLRSLTHPDLSYVFPGGSVIEGGAAMEPIRRAWGANRDLRMATPRRTTRLLMVEGRVVVAEAIELQAGARAVARARHARRSTLVFLVEPSAPWGLVLWRLHESLVPTAEEEAFDWQELETE